MTFWSQLCFQRSNGNRRQPDPQHEPGPNEWVVAHGRGTVPPAVVKTSVVLPPSVMMPPNVERGIVTQLSDGARQLVLEVLICPPNSENKKIKALIDTGAQINVIRRGLFPEQVLQDAKRPLMLTLADGQAFWGGDKEIVAVLVLGKEVDNEVKPWKTKANFYEGEIRADAILGFPWLAQNGLDVFTREGCLGQRKGNKVTSITDCPEINLWDEEDIPLIDTRPIHECDALRRRPKRRQPK